MKKLVRRTLAISAAFLLLFSFSEALILHAFDGHASALTGDGTSSYPYRVTDCAELHSALTDHSTAHIAVMNDISDCGSWTPISSFSGSLDGRNHTVSNITINNPSDDDQAMIINSQDGAVIKNLVITNETVAGNNRVAGLIDFVNGNLTIDHVSVDATISALRDAGGMIQQVTGTGNATISFSQTHGTITLNTTQLAGGIVGELDTGSISDSFSDVAIIETSTSGSYTGGLTGFMYEAATITRSYAAGSISGANVAGGLTGAISTGSNINDSFSVVTFTSSNSIGGLIGSEFTGVGTVTNSYFDQTKAGTSNCDQNGAMTGCTAINTDGTDGSHFKNTTSVAPFTTGFWDFTNNWTMTSNYPSLQLSTPVALADPSAPGIPTDLNADAGVGPAIDLSWTAPSSNGADITDYIVEYRLHTVDDSASWSTFDDGVSTNTFATVTGLEISTEYDFRVSAVNDIGQSDPTDQVTATSGSDQVYDITNCDELQAMNNDLSGDYSLHNDIDCSDTVSWNAGQGFDPIGPDPGEFFAGSFDGQGHTITGLTINQPDNEFTGLFGFTNGYIHDVKLKDVNISGGSYTGGIAGVLIEGEADAVSVEGAVTGSSNIDFGYGPATVVGVGGIAGVLDQSSLTQASSSGTITGTNNDPANLESVGGLVGQIIDSSTLSDSYSTADVVSGDGEFITIGGAVGWVLPYGGDSDSSTIENIYSAGTVTAQSGNLVGGLLAGLEDGELINSYSAAEVTAPGDAYTGGAIGEVGGTITGLYLDVGRAGTDICIGSDPEGSECTVVNTIFDQNSSYFFGNKTNPPLNSWDFNTVWTTRSGHDPILRSDHPGQVYDITNCDELQAIQDDLAGSYTLANNIDCSETIDWNDGVGFVPIGNDDTPFTGTLNGNGHTISSLFINSSSYAGLFGVTQGASISNLTIAAGDSGSVYGEDYSGVLVGKMTDGSINHVIVDEPIEATADSGVGGLAGHVSCSTDSSASIAHSSSAGDVLYDHNDSWDYGGLIGNITTNANGCSVAVNHTSASGSVSYNDVGYGGYYNGGLIGEVDVYLDTSVTINNSHATGNIPNTFEGGGGLIGYFYVDTTDGTGTVRNSYATGDVEIDNNTHDDTGYAGGLLGGMDNEVQVSNSYATGNVAGTFYVGGLVGSIEDFGGTGNTVNLEKTYATGNVTDNSDGGEYIGGLVGVTTNSIISDSYATGTITSDNGDVIGGLIGYFEGDLVNSYSSSTINIVSETGDIGGLIGMYGGTESDDQSGLLNNFAAAKVNITDGSSVGGIIGSDSSGGSIPNLTSNYYDPTYSGQSVCVDSDNPQGCSTATVGSFVGNKTSPPLSSWNFNSIWVVNKGHYPLFVSLTSSHHSNGKKTSSSTGSGSNTSKEAKILLNDFSDYTDGGGKKLDNLKQGQVIDFDIDINGATEHHTATVKEVGQDYVIFTIASTPFDVRISVGETKLISINGLKVLSITVNSVNNSLVSATFKQANQSIATVNVDTGLNSTSTITTLSQPKNASESLYMVLALALLAGSMLLILTRHRSHQKYSK